MKMQMGAVLLDLLSEAKLNQRDLSKMIGIAAPSLSVLINKGLRPKEETLKRLVSCWPKQTQNMRVLIAHLHDEAERAGVNVSRIVVDDVEHEPQRDDEFSLIKRLYQSDTLVKQIVDRFATLCKRIEGKNCAGRDELKLVAEKREKYME